MHGRLRRRLFGLLTTLVQHSSSVQAEELFLIIHRKPRSPHQVCLLNCGEKMPISTIMETTAVVVAAFDVNCSLLSGSSLLRKEVVEAGFSALPVRARDAECNQRNTSTTQYRSRVSSYRTPVVFFGEGQTFFYMLHGRCRINAMGRSSGVQPEKYTHMVWNGVMLLGTTIQDLGKLHTKRSILTLAVLCIYTLKVTLCFILHWQSYPRPSKTPAPTTDVLRW